MSGSATVVDSGSINMTFADEDGLVSMTTGLTHSDLDSSVV